MVLRDLGDKEISVARGINYYLGVIKGVIIGPGRGRDNIKTTHIPL